jgi:hypothetical protein
MMTPAYVALRPENVSLLAESCPLDGGTGWFSAV